MKSTSLPLLGVALCGLFTTVNPTFAQGTAFTYNGRLNDGGSPANGNYDLTFSLFDADSGPNQVGSTLTNSATAVSNGLFTATLDFGAGAFTGANRWLEMNVRTNGGGAFTTLSPRQQIMPTPYAIYSANAGSAATANTATTAVSANSVSGTNITGTISDAQLSANVALLNGSANFSGAVTASSFTGSGALAYQTVAGTAQSAAANTGYVLTNDARTTVTLPTTASAGDLVRVLGTGAGGWQVQADDSQTLLGGNAYGPAGATWTPRESNRSWYSPASSEDGVKLVAVDATGQIYTSTDSGVTWTARASNRFWNSVASSADGTRLVAVVYDGQIYTSTDSGMTWTARESNRAWTRVASSADGTKLIAGVYGGQLYTSTDSGVTWTARESNRGWLAVASSADGTKLVAGGNGGGGGGADRIYTSTDSGVTWTARESSRDWRSFASSADGTKLLAVTYLDQIYTSTDSGVTWTARESSRSWHGAASSADGTRLVALEYFGQIYTSTDSGVTWTARESNRIWNGVASSADGTKMVAVEDGGQIYTSVGASIFTGGSGTVAGFQYLGNNVWQAVVEASAASAGSVAATNLTGTVQLAQLPGTILTNNQNGVSLTGTFTGNGASLTNLNAVAKTGDTMTGTLNLPANGLVAGTKQLVLSGGNVGIGTTTPSAKLHVGGGTRFSVADVGSIFLQSGTGGTGRARDWKIYSSMEDPGGNLAFRDMGFDNFNNGMAGDAMVIQAGTGKVGIGTTSPATTLDVNGTVTANNFSGNGAGLTNLSVSVANLVGTLADARLSANVALLNANQTFTGHNTFLNPILVGTSIASAFSAGSVTISAGPQPGSGSGGSVVIQSGAGAAGNYVGDINLTAASVASGVNGNINITASDNNGGGGNTAGSVNIRAGNQTGAANGGTVSITGGAANGANSSQPGGVAITGGANTGNNPQNGAGANVTIAGGAQTAAAALGPGGSVILRGGVSSGSGAHGSIVMQTGAASATRVTVDQNGNVGIGKANPATVLDVNGAVTATSFSGSGTGLINISANAIVGGLTTNIAVLVAGGGTNTLCFTNGVLRAVQ